MVLEPSRRRFGPGSESIGNRRHAKDQDRFTVRGGSGRYRADAFRQPARNDRTTRWSVRSGGKRGMSETAPRPVLDPPRSDHRRHRARTVATVQSRTQDEDARAWEKARRAGGREPSRCRRCGVGTIRVRGSKRPVVRDDSSHAPATREVAHSGRSASATVSRREMRVNIEQFAAFGSGYLGESV